MSLMSRVREFVSPTPNVPLPDPELRDYWPYFNFDGHTYPLLRLNQTLPGSKQEEIDPTFGSYVRAYQGNSVLFALMAARMRLFTQTRFQWRRLRNGKPGDLFGTADLRILERPWPNGNTADLLGRMIQDVDLAGNCYLVRRAGPRIARLQPDWVTIIHDRPVEDPDSTVVGYGYQPGGPGMRKPPIYYDVSEVAHFIDIPDPQARTRGMSWITPLVRQLMADNAATDHLLGFYERGATPNLVVKRSDEIGKDAFAEWVRLMETGHAGVANAYRTLYLSAGADATVVGANLRQLDFALTQGHGETRMAAAAGVPPIVAGLSEGLAASTYSNYAQARRAFADLTMMALWANAAQSLETIVPPPGGSELWIDTNIPFLAEDKKDQAAILKEQMTTIEAGVRSGYEPSSVVAAVTSGDLTLLTHTGLYSVQLQPPGTEAPEPEAEPEAEAETEPETETD